MVDVTTWLSETNPRALLKFLHDRIGDPTTATGRNDLDGVGYQTEHALLLKASFEGADRFRMCVGFLRPLSGGAILQEHQRADDLIAPLNRIAESRL